MCGTLLTMLALFCRHLASLSDNARLNVFLTAALFVGSTLSCGGGAGTSGGGNETTPQNPLPSISSLSPSSSIGGAQAQTLTIYGTNFISSSTVTYNGVAHTPVFVDSKQLLISLTAADQAVAGRSVKYLDFHRKHCAD